MEKTDTKIRLLIVDDEEEFLLSSSQALRRRGFEVDVAPNGITALEKVEKNEYDVVMLDVKMPDIDGIEVFRQVHRIYPDLPIVLLTGHSSIGDAFQTSKEGIADYLAKPVDMDELARRIKRATIRHETSEPGDDDDSLVLDAGESIRVMIVDDEIDFLDTVKKVFQRRGLNVVTAVSGHEALDMLSENLVDVVVLDVRMPGMDGLEALRLIKKGYPGIDVILLSGHPSVDAALEGVRLGASEYLKKPPDINALVATINKLYQERKRISFEQRQKLIDDIRRRYPE